MDRENKEKEPWEDIPFASHDEGLSEDEQEAAEEAYYEAMNDIGSYTPIDPQIERDLRNKKHLEKKSRKPTHPSKE